MSIENDVVHHSHGRPKIHLAINIIHLLATAGAAIETARELIDWLHLL